MATDLPSCDVIIPYHEPTVRWLPMTIDSILNQQHAECIVHLIADAIDPSLDEGILREYEHLPQVRMYRNTERLGPYQSLHAIFSHLETDYIAIQDSDDIALPHRIWHSVTSMREHDADIFGGAQENFIDWQSRENPDLKQYVDWHGNIMFSGVHVRGTPSGRVNNPTMVVKKSCFEELNGFSCWLTGCDTEFIERAHRAGAKVHVSDAVVLLRRKHGSSFASSVDYGNGSDVSERIFKQRNLHYNEFTPGFDPKLFGSLHKKASRMFKCPFCQNVSHVFIPEHGAMLCPYCDSTDVERLLALYAKMPCRSAEPVLILGDGTQADQDRWAQVCNGEYADLESFAADSHTMHDAYHSIVLTIPICHVQHDRIPIRNILGVLDKQGVIVLAMEPSAADQRHSLQALLVAHGLNVDEHDLSDDADAQSMCIRRPFTTLTCRF